MLVQVFLMPASVPSRCSCKQSIALIKQHNVLWRRSRASLEAEWEIDIMNKGQLGHRHQLCPVEPHFS